MLHGDALGLLLGAVALGAVHGVEPGHGWPVAASYALDRSNKWAYGFAAGLIIGVGHLVSSIAMVAVFFYAKSFFALTEVDGPITVVGDIQVGGPVSIVAGVLLIALGIREYRHGHSHEGNGDHGHDHADAHDHDRDNGHGHHHDDSEAAHGHQADSNGEDHDHSHGDHAHGPDPLHDRGRQEESDPSGLIDRLKGVLPFTGGHSHSHSHDGPGAAADRGLVGIAWFAFVLGFAHEEEFEIIALCAGSEYCLELMTAYAVTVIVGIVGLTMLLIGGYHRYEERVEQYTPYLPAFSATVLVVMGLGFVTGIF